MTTKISSDLISNVTGSGNAVLNTSPTLVTPVLGVASATTVNKVTITAPTTSATLTLAQGSSLITSGAFSITLTATAATNVTLPTSGTLATVGGNIGAATGTSFNSITGLASVAPLINGTAAVGTSTLTARQDHVHPSQTIVANISGGLGGSIPYQTAVNTTAMLANGTAGYVLQSNGTTLAPSWVKVSGGATGAGNDGIFVENDTLITTNYTLGQGALVSGVTVDAGTDIFTLNNHGFTEGQLVQFYNATPANLPAPLVAATGYYVIATNLTANTFMVSATRGGSTVAITTAGTVPHSVGKVKNAISAGAISIATGVTVTVPTNATWSIS
jgi:hypothetical protein